MPMANTFVDDALIYRLEISLDIANKREEISLRVTKS